MTRTTAISASERITAVLAVVLIAVLLPIGRAAAAPEVPEVPEVPQSPSDPDGPWTSVTASGATGDGITDDTEAFRGALAGAGQVYVPAGRYVISSKVTVPSDTTLWLSPGATLLGSITDHQGDCMLDLYGIENVTIIGGVLDGQKDLNPTGYLYGICVWGPMNRNVRIIGTEVRDMPAKDETGGNGGDGFYIGAAKNVRLERVVADGNVRQGLSMTGPLSHVDVVDSVFTNTSGINPGAGIDIEPNPGGFAFRDVSIRGSVITGNQWGLIVTRWADPKGTMRNIEIVRNDISGNRREGLYITSSRATPMTVRIAHNRIRDNGLTGMVVRKKTAGAIFGNEIEDNLGDGLHLQDDTARMNVKRNRVARNEDSGILIEQSHGFRIIRNLVTGNGEHGIVTPGRRPHRRAGIVRKNRVRNNRLAVRS